MESPSRSAQALGHGRVRDIRDVVYVRMRHVTLTAPLDLRIDGRTRRDIVLKPAAVDCAAGPAAAGPNRVPRVAHVPPRSGRPD
jgi:hypothetical protein